MTHMAYYKALDLHLNLSLEDSGCPDRPDIWEQLRSQKLPRGALVCAGCGPRGQHGCTKNSDGAVHLRVQGGIRQVVHYADEINRHHPTAEESDTHKALKDYIAESAERHGYRATVEHTAAHRRRRADVTIKGAAGRELRCEAQVSDISPATVIKRDRIDRHDGASPLWITREVKGAAPLWVDRSPWALLRPTPWQAIASGVPLDVRGGVRDLVFERCGSRSPLCPDARNRPGRSAAPCGKEHAYFDAKHAVLLRELVGEMAAGEMVDIRVPRSNGSNYHIVAAHDADEWASYQEAAEVVESEPEEQFNQLEDRYECDPRPWKGPGQPTRRPNPSARVYSGITRDGAGRPTAAAGRCSARGCDPPGHLPWCQLCPESPTYYRGAAS